MRQYYKNAEDEKLVFAETAAKHFEENPLNSTFTEGDIVRGAWFARRWGADGDCVVVFKIDEYEEVVNYCEMMDKTKARESRKRLYAPALLVALKNLVAHFGFDAPRLSKTESLHVKEAWDAINAAEGK